MNSNLILTKMKNVLFYLVIAFAILSSSSMMAQQGFGTNTPDKSAAVDIVSTKRGLLMPRIELTATDVAAPVTNPANSLMVYNTNTAGAGATAVTPGFYFWDTDRWVRFVDADGVKTTTVSAGDGVTVTSEVDGNETDFKVSVTAGTAEDMVMVTIEDPDNPGEFITSWVSYDDLLDDLLNVENGLTYDPDTNTLTLGGALTQPTTIETDGVNTLTITGLQAWDDDAAADGNLDDAKIVVMNPDGTLRTISYNDLVINADNGLNYDEATNTVKLGGDLTEATAIGTDDVNTLAITGLQAADAANKIVVADAASGVLRTVARVLTHHTTTTITVADDVADYSSYAQEVTITVALAAADVDVVLPAAAAANEGQVVNIKITNTDDTHDGFVNIKAGATTLTYGAMPYQGWIVKSNGSSWVIVGRN